MTDAVNTSATKPGIWAGLFCVNMAIIAVLHISGAIEPPVPYILMALSFILLIPMGRAAKRRQEERGAMSPALRRYNKRVLLTSFGYMAALLVAIYLSQGLDEASPVMWLVAAAPILPVMGMIFAMFRYLREESDEYLRLRAVNGALVGLGGVLVIGTAWGFFEMFGLLPSVWAWWVFPIWSLGLGVGMCWRSDGSGDDA